MQVRRLDVHSKLEQPHNQEWIDIVLSFFKSFVEDQMHLDLAVIGKENLREYTENLLRLALKAISETEKG